jgi:hypothetical protein
LTLVPRLIHPRRVEAGVNADDPADGLVAGKEVLHVRVEPFVVIGCVWPNMVLLAAYALATLSRFLRTGLAPQIRRKAVQGLPYLREVP